MNDLLASIARQHGTPCYVYLADHLLQRADALHHLCGGRFAVSYAVKANPHPALLRLLKGRADWLDVSSGGELRAALSCGWRADRITFAGPAKSAAELALAARIRIGAVVLESLTEAEALDRLVGASDDPAPLPVLVRLSPARLPPGFGVRMAGRPVPFGFDEEDAERAILGVELCRNLELVGFHVYSGTQCLDPAAVAENWSIAADLFRRMAEARDLWPRLLVLGAGLGIPYHDDDEPLRLAEVEEHAAPALATISGTPCLAEATLLLETGRYLVGEAGFYLTRVVRVKESRGSRIAILDGGLHHHLAACGQLGGVIHRHYRVQLVEGAAAGEEPVPHDLAGPLCAAVDTLGRNVELPPLRAGDLLAVRSSGAYGLTASPVHFLSHPPPKEILVETRKGKLVVRDVTC